MDLKQSLSHMRLRRLESSADKVLIKGVPLFGKAYKMLLIHC